jgi:hypothetical protein
VASTLCLCGAGHKFEWFSFIWPDAGEMENETATTETDKMTTNDLQLFISHPPFRSTMRWVQKLLGDVTKPEEKGVYPTIPPYFYFKKYLSQDKGEGIHSFPFPMFYF